MIVHACEDCKTLNTTTKLYTYNAAQVNFDSGFSVPDGKFAYVSVAVAIEGSQGKRYCYDCMYNHLTADIQNLDTPVRMR